MTDPTCYRRFVVRPVNSGVSGLLYIGKVAMYPKTFLSVIAIFCLVAVSACSQDVAVTAVATPSSTATEIVATLVNVTSIGISVLPTPTNTDTPVPPTATPTLTLTPTATETPTSTPTRMPTYTATSTVTPDPNRIPLPEVLGFSDEHIEWLDENKFKLNHSATTTFNGKQYLALEFVQTEATPQSKYYDDFLWVFSLLLVYQKDSNQYTLLLDTRSPDLPGLWAVVEVSSTYVEEWGDLNQDGIPDLIVYYHNIGNAWSLNSQVHLWQIGQQNNFIDLTEPIYDQYKLIPQRKIEDRNGDGVLDLWVGDYRGEWYNTTHVGGVSSFKIFAWQNDEVNDISAEFKGEYNERIKGYIDYIKASYAEVVEDKHTATTIATTAFALLMDYENSGRREEGWQIYWELTAPENWVKLSPETFEIITARREWHEIQYEANEPFR